MILIEPKEPPDYYGRALAAYTRNGVDDAEMGAAFFAMMSEALDTLIEEAERRWTLE